MTTQLIKCLECKQAYYKDMVTKDIGGRYFCPFCNKVTKHKLPEEDNE